MSNLADLSLDEVVRLTSGTQPGGQRGHRGSRQGHGRDRPHGVQKRPDRPVYSGQNRFGARRGFRRPNQSGENGSGNPPPTRLIVSNLAPSVTEDDLFELFSEFENLVGASMHFDKAGRGLGIATVTYWIHASGLQAIERYNGVPLDGVPMTIALAPSSGEAEVEPISSPASSSVTSGSSSAERFNRGFGRKFKFNRPANKFNRAGNKSDCPANKFERSAPKFERPIPSASQLDDDLEKYMEKRLKTKKDLDHEMDAYQAQKPATTITDEDTAMLYE